MPPFRTVAVALAGGGLCLLTGCGVSQPGSPLQSRTSVGPLQSLSSGGPLQSLSKDGQHVVDAGGSEVTPGESADTTAVVVNDAAAPVTLVSASLLPVSGHPVGHLTGAAVVVGNNFLGGGHGWPPDVPVRPFTGAILHHGRNHIVLGMSGPAAGRVYVAAGLKITYRYRGALSTMTAWAVVSACVVPEVRIDHSYPLCDRETNSAWTEVRNEAG